MPAQTGARGEEPMFLQRPSTGKSQDVRHILAKTFREIFTRDPVGTDSGLVDRVLDRGSNGC